jgi:hypothetical protein
MGQPLGSHADSYQITLFQDVDFVGQGHNLMEFKRSRLLTPCPLEFRESAYRGRESWFMILAVEKCLVPPRREVFIGSSRKP